MKRLFIFSLFGFLFFSSCSNRANHVQIVSLPDAAELTSISKSIDVSLLIPAKIFIKGNKLLVFEPLSKDMFKVFEFPSFTYLYSFGDQGGGPNEFRSSAIGNDEIIDDTDTELVEVLDHTHLKFVDFSGASPNIQSVTPIPVSRFKPINRLKKMNDSIYYFLNWFDGNEKNEFTRINLNTGERTYFSPYPDWVKNLTSTDEKYKTYSKSSIYSFIHKKIVVFYYQFPVMKFIDFDGEVIKEIHVDTQKSNFNVPNKGNILYFVEGAFLTNDFIYVLWFGGKNKNEIMNEPNNFKPEILVFDWDGNVAGRYQLEKSITSFTISEKTGKIYGTPFPGEDEINVIYEFDLLK
jgi:hypothetical protein